jgi:hypothetical protein
MTTENTPKKEGGAVSAITSLFGKKARIPANLSAEEPIHVTNPAAVIEAWEKVPSIFEKKNPAEVIGLGISYSEVGVAEELGISSEDVTWLRKGLLEAGKDYTREAGFVRITASGLAKLEARLAQEDTLIVQSAHVVNPRLVLARQPGNADVMRVRVADNSQWCRGMIMSGCVKAADLPKFWSCTDRPRFKGRV